MRPGPGARGGKERRVRGVLALLLLLRVVWRTRAKRPELRANHVRTISRFTQSTGLLPVHRQLMTASSRFRRLHDAQVGTPLQHPAHLALSHLAASSNSSSRPSDSSPSKEPASDPLYPAYLPTRPEDFSRAEAHPKFEVQEAGLRADAQLPTLTRLLLDVGRAEDITPRIGTECVFSTPSKCRHALNSDLLARTGFLACSSAS